MASMIEAGRRLLPWTTGRRITDTKLVDLYRAMQAADPDWVEREELSQQIEQRIRELEGDRRNFDFLSAADERELSVLRSIRKSLARTASKEQSE